MTDSSSHEGEGNGGASQARSVKPNNPIESVLFDLDNTLIDRTGGFHRFCVTLYRSDSAINEVSTQEEALELMAELDEAGLYDRFQLFDNRSNS